MTLKSKIRGIYIQQTLSLITELTTPPINKRVSVEFPLSELSHFPKVPKTKYHVQAYDSWFPTIRNNFFITTYEDHSHLKRLRLKGATSLGYYELEFTKVVVADKYNGAVVLTIRADEGLAPLMPVTSEQAHEIALSVLNYPETWFNETGFGARVDEITKYIRFGFRTVLATSVVLLSAICGLIVSQGLS